MDKSWSQLIEQEAKQLMGGELVAKISIAISLKRIADIMEKNDGLNVNSRAV